MDINQQIGLDPYVPQCSLKVLTAKIVQLYRHRGRQRLRVRKNREMSLLYKMIKNVFRCHLGPAHKKTTRMHQQKQDINDTVQHQIFKNWMSNFYPLLITQERLLQHIHALKLFHAVLYTHNFIKHQYGAWGKISSPQGKRELKVEQIRNYALLLAEIGTFVWACSC